MRSSQTGPPVTSGVLKICVFRAVSRLIAAVTMCVSVAADRVDGVLAGGVKLKFHGSSIDVIDDKRATVASIARDDPSTLSGDDPFPRARMHRDRNLR